MSGYRVPLEEQLAAWHAIDERLETRAITANEALLARLKLAREWYDREAAHE